MPTCSNCKTYFRTLIDEEGIHSCPKCGYEPKYNESIRKCYDDIDCDYIDLDCYDCEIYKSLQRL